ncbi:hypothetical protein LP085_16805 [Achromobacter sp. MY14]|uniref:hypothetical protein n=1 Tax=unclassified Achromobacter TaxID=2626865 RepID=UPI001E364D1C|nr:hypothetical protein [Achromobacter sp. MY14]MCD0498519.1 hypothetical protein [Achromobacter sp. MY14]
MTLANSRLVRSCRPALAVATLLVTAAWATPAAAQASPFPPMMRGAAAAPIAGCMMSFGQATVDYGSFTAGQLTLDGNRRYQLEPRLVPLTINCPTARPIALRLNATAGQHGATKFASTGALHIVLSHVRIDGDETRLVNPDAPHGAQPRISLRPGDTVMLEHGRAGRSLTAQIALNPEVADADVRVADQTVWSATLQLELVDM